MTAILRRFPFIERMIPYAQAHAHFTHTYDTDVQYSISPSSDEDGLYRVTIDGHGIYRARALRGGWKEVACQCKHQNFLLTPNTTYLLIEPLDTIR